MSFLRTFGWSLAVTAVALVVAVLYDGAAGLALCAILGILEISLSFDNAVVNASVLRRMSPFWQRIFLTIGIVIAVFGMRLVFPILIVSLSSGLGPVEAVQLALQGGDPSTPGTYGYILTAAHPVIAGFGGMFLLLLFLNYIFDTHEHQWLGPVERALSRLGRVGGAPVIVSTAILVLVSEFLTDETERVLLAGVLGLITYLVVDGLGNAFESAMEDEDEDDEEDVPAGPQPAGSAAVTTPAETPAPARSGPSQLAVVAGRSAFFLFLYLEVLDATFSFDGVIGAFAVTSDPILIALGLGLIGAMFVRSLTVFLVRQGTLDDYVYLESGAHWAIGALAVILLFTVGIEVNAIVTGLVGVVIIALAFASSLVRNRRIARGDGGSTGGDDEGGGGVRPSTDPTSSPARL